MKIYYFMCFTLICITYNISLYFSPKNNNLYEEVETKKLNNSYTGNYKYKYNTIYTNNLKSKELQNILWKNTLNGWTIYTTNNNYITLFKENEKYKNNKI